MAAGPAYGSPSELPFRWLVVEASEHPEIMAGRDLGVLLSCAEQEQLRRFRFERRRRKWMLGRLAAKHLLRQVLLENANQRVALTDIEIRNAPSGAPLAEWVGGGQIPWPISISHRIDWGAAAVALPPGRAVGIDLETIEARAPGWYADYFTDQEMAALPCAGPCQDLAVATIWSAKEAVLKVLGVGLRLDTRWISVRANFDDATEVTATSGATDVGASVWRPLEIVLGQQIAVSASFRAFWRRERDYVLTAVVL